VLASAASLAMLGLSLEAQALALGAITVRSALGEPLRAEIEVPQISSEEAESFQASLASPEAFRAAGVEYSPALAGARLSLQRRLNGQAYLRLVSDRPVNEPFLGVVIEANWATGRMVRDYTMLVDPPSRAAAPAPTPPQLAEAPPPITRPSVAEQVTRPARPDTSQARPAPSAQASRPQSLSADGGGRVTVRRGDTAYRIATNHLPEGVSLDQMLMAMLRANPNAFIRGNVNLMKAGAVLDIPGTEQAQALSRGEASRSVAAQTRDFHEYRRGLAQNAPRTEVEAASQSASGQVSASVQESAAPAAADRLTISKGTADAASDTASAPSQAETGLAQTRQAQEQAERIAELNRNIAELARLQNPAAGSEAAGGTPSIAVPAGAVPGASAAAASDSAPAATGATLAPVDAASAAASPGNAASAEDSASVAAADAASAASPGTTPAEPAPAPAPPPSPVAKPAPLNVEEPSFVDALKENPLLPIAGAGLLALLAAYGVYRSRQKKKDTAPLDSALTESRPQSDSFFGSSGGQHVDTTSEKPSLSAAAPSSMMYSPSQIDTAGDVDPVAEADVYLAYGRDLQAEEILKEALRVHPGKVSIQRKLVEIYVKRRDARAVEALATEIHAATGGTGSDWAYVREQGRKLDPENKLYALTDFSADAGGAVDTTAAFKQGFSADTSPMSTRLMDDKLPSELPSLDLDLSDAPLKADPVKPSGVATTLAATSAGVAAAGAAAALRPPAAAPAAAEPRPATSAPAKSELTPLDFDLDLDLGAPERKGASEPTAPDSSVPGSSAAATPPTTVGAELDSGMIEFDLEALSVDPDSRVSELRTEQPDDADDDPLSTKLALAREFHAIGDTEGALSLIKEVVAEASGPLKARAERFLKELS